MVALKEVLEPSGEGPRRQSSGQHLLVLRSPPRSCMQLLYTVMQLSTCWQPRAIVAAHRVLIYLAVCASHSSELRTPSPPPPLHRHPGGGAHRPRVHAARLGPRLQVPGPRGRLPRHALSCLLSRALSGGSSCLVPPGQLPRHA